MPLDERMRETFDRIGALIEPDIERGLRRTTERSGGRGVAPSLAWLAAAAAVVLVVAVIVRGSLGTDLGGVGSSPDTGSTTPMASSRPSYDAIAGSYQVDLASGNPSVLELGLAGRWTMTLHASGAIDLEPPASFTGSRAQGHTFALDGDSLRTDLYYNDYCDSVGTYRWARAGEELLLTPIDDGCDIRVALLSTHPWSAAP